MYLKNPFADYGGIVTGNRFIGRKIEIEKIQNRLLGVNYGNVAIIGLPRIGKSSLAWNAIIEDKANLIKKKIIPIWISFGEYSSLKEVFHEVFSSLMDVSAELEVISCHISETYLKYIDSKNNLEGKRYVKKILKLLKNNNFRLLLIFDEFDNAKNILSLNDFQFLREVCNNPETTARIRTRQWCII